MTRKLLYVAISCVLFAFVFSNFPLLAQQAEKAQQAGKEKDIAEFSLEELLNVEITTAGKKAEKISEIPASVIVITREDIERYGYRSISEILENVPGVYAIDDMSFYGTSFGMRGFWGAAQRNVIVMVNGVHQVEDFFQVSTPDNFKIPVEAIDRVEVVRGPMSVIYGSGAFFGAINIITNQAEEGKNVNVLSASAGSLETYQAAAKFSGSSGDFKYAFSAGAYKTHGPNEPLSKMSTMDLSGFGINSTNNTTDGRLGDNNKYFNLSLDYKGFYGKMSISEYTKENYIFVPSVSKGTRTNANFNIVSVGYKKDISDKVNLDLSLTYHKHHWWAVFDFFDPSFYGYEFMNSREIEADVTATIKPDKNLNITAGLHYKQISDANAYDSIPAFGLHILYKSLSPMRTPSIFLQSDYSISAKLKVLAGLRVEQIRKYDLASDVLGDDAVNYEQKGTYKNDKVQFIPRFALIYSINAKNYLKLLYGKAIRHPDLQPNIENMKFSKPDLNPEYINTFELNYISSPSQYFTINFSLFYNRLKNLIVRTQALDPDLNFITYYANGGDIETVGSELSIIAKPFNNFLLDLSGTYQKSKDKRPGFENIDVAYSPKLLAHLKASYKFGGGVTFALTGRYVDKMVPLYATDIQARIGQPVDAYFVLGANLRIDNLFVKGFYINIRVNNLFDENYLYPVNENVNLFADLGTIGRGLKRAFMVTLGKKW